MECKTSLQKARARQRGNQNENTYFKQSGGEWTRKSRFVALVWKNGGAVAGSEEAEQEASLFHAQKGKLKCCRGRWRDGKIVRPTEGTEHRSVKSWRERTVVESRWSRRKEKQPENEIPRANIWAEIKLARTPSSELGNVTRCCLIYLSILPKSYVATGLPNHTLLVAFL